nr:hypothetical protein [Tanacetum cinerariifolium]
MLRASTINNLKDELDYLHHMKQMKMEEWTVWLPISEWIKEDYHKIKNDIPLVSVYTIGNVLERGMLILVFLTEEICVTDDFKEYETVFMNVDVPMNQLQPVVST